MKTSLRLLLIPIILFMVNVVYANDEPIQFNNKNHEQRYYELIEEIRCLVCQNQSLADSNAPLAQDLRKEVYDMIVSEKKDKQIMQFLVERYGDFVLYRPPLKQNTWLLWFGPFLFLIVAIAVAIILIKKQSDSNSIKNDISEEEQQRLTELLDENSNRGKQ